MQATLEAVAWNRKRRWTLFLAWVGGEPLGVVPVPWCRAELWREYAAFKARSVDRTKSASFRDRQHVARLAMRMYDDEWIVDHLLNVVTTKKKKPTDFEGAVKTYRGDMMTESQSKRVAYFMFTAARALHHLEPTFEERFGVKVNEGLRAVAEAMRTRAQQEDAGEE